MSKARKLMLYNPGFKPSDVDLVLWLGRYFKSLAKYAWEGAI